MLIKYGNKLGGALQYFNEAQYRIVIDILKDDFNASLQIVLFLSEQFAI